MCDKGTCNDASCCGECEPWNCLEQQINDALATKEGQLQGYVNEAKDAAAESKASAEASAQAAAESKEFRDEAETAASTAVAAEGVVLGVANTLQDTADKLEQVADELNTAIAGIAVSSWFYTTVSENQTVIPVPVNKNAVDVQSIYIEGARQSPFRGFEFDKTAMIITLAEPLPLGLEIEIILGTYNSDNPNDFAHTLASNNGASLVGTSSGNTVQEVLNSHSGSFQTGVKLLSSNDIIVDKSVNPNQLYRWDGELPKTVPVGSTPASTGGVGMGAWVSVGDASLRSDLASHASGEGAELVALKQQVSNAKERTVHDWIGDIITAKDGDSIVADGINNDSVGINAFLPVLASAQRELLLVPGVYLINDDITIDIPVTIQPGAILKPRNGAQLTFISEIRAGCYKIFDTEDDFYTSPVAVPSVKIAKGGVKPEWFGAATVSSYDDIASAVNCSPAFMKAWRATTGEYTANVTTSYRQSEYTHSYIDLAAGKYRMDKEVFLGHTDFTPTTVRYNKNGGGVIGKGAGLSILVFTDSEYNGNAYFTANDMSGEMHTFKGFKCVSFDPTKTGVAQYETKVGAMILIGSADSITTSDLWAAGATTVVADTNGFGRGGVGIQFDSLVDHQFSDLLVEHCVHGVAFSSCISTGNNIKGFANKISDLSFGNYIPDWPQMVSQTTKNTIGVNGFESKFCLNTSITFGTYDNMVDISGVVVDGRTESSLSVVTNRVIGFGVGGGVSGTISGSARNLLLGLIADFGVSFAGRDGAPLRLNFDIENIVGASSSENAVVSVDKSDSNLIGSIGISSSVFPILRSSSTTTTIEIKASDITLTTGSPSGTNAILCKGGNLNVTALKISNSTGITGLVYAENSSVLLPTHTISPTRAVTKVGGGTIKSYSITDFA